jgi:hypothetical protein
MRAKQQTAVLLHMAAVCTSVGMQDIFINIFLFCLLQPLVSARNALYDMLWDEAALKSALGYGRADIMQDDIHPAFFGEP